MLSDTDDSTDVQPTKALFFGATPCEKRAAIIRNKARRNIRNNEVEIVAYRYCQTKAGENETFGQLITLTFYFFLLVIVCCINKGYLDQDFDDRSKKMGLMEVFLLSLISLPFIGKGLANFANFDRYKQTKNDCLDFLSKHFSKDKVELIKSCSHNKEGLTRIRTLMRMEQIAPLIAPEELPRSVKWHGIK